MPSGPPRSMRDHAANDVTFIRSAMERSSAFTAIPGRGGMVTGLIGLIAAVVAARQPTRDRWLGVWLVAAAIAVVVELMTMVWKARRARLTLTGANTRRFALGLAAPLVAGAAITYELWTVRSFTVMAPAWLLLDGGLQFGFGAYIARHLGG